MRQLLRRAWYWLHEGRRREELREELEFHRAMAERDLARRGADRSAARLAARRSFGSSALAGDHVRDVWVPRPLQGFGQDVRLSLRTLRRTPIVSAVAIASLAIGIGANTAIFSLIRTILLASLPFPDPERLAIIWTVPPNDPEQRNGAMVPDYVAWRDQNRSFAAMGASWSYTRTFGAEDNGVSAERIIGQSCTPGFLEALGIQPIRGRLFTEAEDQVDNTAAVVVLGEHLWRTRFGADPDILDKSIRLDGRLTRVIGVVGSDMRFFGGGAQDSEFFEPFRFYRQQLQGSPRFVTVVGRLKGDASIEQAQSDLATVAKQVAAQFPTLSTVNGKPWGVRVEGLQRGLVRGLATPLLLLQGAVGFVLLIACANVAGLLLARATSRYREVGMRLALGAGRARLVRQFLTESVILALVGGAFGVLFGWAALRGLVWFAPPWIPRLDDIALDAEVLTFSLVTSAAAGLIFGIVPALHTSNPNVRGPLADPGRVGTPGARAHRLRALLVASQIALALISLTGAGLVIRSFLRLAGTPLNADPSGILTFRIELPQGQYGKTVGMHNGLPLWEISPRPAQIFSDLLERARSVPAAQSAAAAVLPPFNGGPAVSFVLTNRPGADPVREALTAFYYPISADFFRTMRTPVVRGREFTDRDTAGAPWVAVVNETMTRRYWPDGDVIGNRLTLALGPDERPREIVGVVHDTPSYIGEERSEPKLYVPFVQMPPTTPSSFASTRVRMTFVVRTTGNPVNVVPAVRRAAAEIDPNMPLSGIETLENQLARSVEYPRYYATLLGLFAGAAMVLAAIGIYGMIAYGIAQRTREIGIRLALGARGRHVLTLVLRHAVLMLAGGLGVGVAASLALTQLLKSLLWQIEPTDPVTFAASSALVVVVGLVACLVPALRALAVDPTTTLRSE
jgi:putative ABC transport system permease protein